MKSQCIEACFWKNRYWAVGQIYDGDEKTPESKKGRKFFMSLEKSEVKEEGVKVEEKPVEEFVKPDSIPSPNMARWELNQMPKIELQRILAKKYNIKVDEEVTKNKLMDKIIEEQGKREIGNQEIANVVKG